MSPNAAKPTVLDCRPLRAVRQSLVEVFGSGIQLWCRDEGWRLVPMAPDEGELVVVDLAFGPPEMTSVLDGLHAESAKPPTVPVCHEMPGGRLCLFLPLPKRNRVEIAATLVSADLSQSILLSLGRLFLKDLAKTDELDRLRRENQAFVQQVTHDFEELTFLRCMSRLLELSDLSFDYVAMAETMLETLRPLIDADTLLLVDTTDCASGVPDAPLCAAGVLDVVSFATCRRLVEHFSQVAGTTPIVKNHFSATQQSVDFPDIHSFILVPVMSTTSQLGWLLALNRNNTDQYAEEELPWGVSQREFGTHEATLMSSSASILATHAQNVELFRERERRSTGIIRSLVSRVEAGEWDDRCRGERVARYARRFAEELGCQPDSCERLYWAGLLHRIVPSVELDAQERQVLSVVEAYDSITAVGSSGAGSSRDSVEVRLRSLVAPLDDPEWMDVFVRCLPEIEKIRAVLPPPRQSEPVVTGQPA